MDFSDLNTLPSYKAIEILNGLNLDKLIFVFEKYPNIFQQYGSIYNYVIEIEKEKEIINKNMNKFESAELNKLPMEQQINRDE